MPEMQNYRDNVQIQKSIKKGIENSDYELRTLLKEITVMEEKIEYVIQEYDKNILDHAQIARASDIKEIFHLANYHKQGDMQRKNAAIELKQRINNLKEDVSSKIDLIPDVKSSANSKSVLRDGELMDSLIDLIRFLLKTVGELIECCKYLERDLTYICGNLTKIKDKQNTSYRILNNPNMQTPSDPNSFDGRSSSPDPFQQDDNARVNNHQHIKFKLD
jgi:hypothetical protein